MEPTILFVITITNYSVIYSIIHLLLSSYIIDGIGLSASNKQPMWVLICSIVESPRELLNRRQKNLILSIWIGKEQPDIDLWLDQTFTQVAHLKSPGFLTRLGSQIMLKLCSDWRLSCFEQGS
ncbi:unnamed protein product [Rotaria magnacalcarata]|uniref:Uncharacterized protein n=1 Tax=Rotaria magnacalcarata TaxID=392030 RepID=A0A815VQW2_9BILA|nr:unnamed protein product [Rotaria magnacalcarata]